MTLFIYLISLYINIARAALVVERVKGEELSNLSLLLTPLLCSAPLVHFIFARLKPKLRHGGIEVENHHIDAARVNLPLDVEFPSVRRKERQALEATAQWQGQSPCLSLCKEKVQRSI